MNVIPERLLRHGINNGTYNPDTTKHMYKTKTETDKIVELSLFADKLCEYFKPLIGDRKSELKLEIGSLHSTVVAKIKGIDENLKYTDYTTKIDEIIEESFKNTIVNFLKSMGIDINKNNKMISVALSRIRSFIKLRY